MFEEPALGLMSVKNFVAANSEAVNKTWELSSRLTNLKRESRKLSIQLASTKWCSRDLRDFYKCHTAMLVLYSRYFKQFQSQAFDHPSFGIKDIWVDAIVPILSNRNKFLDYKRGVFSEYVANGYTLFFSFYSGCAYPRLDILQALGILSITKRDLVEQNVSLRLIWNEEAWYWFTSALSVSEETGTLHHHLAGLYQEGSIDHVVETVKSMHAIVPWRMKNELFEIFTKARSIHREPLVILIFKTLQSLLIGTDKQRNGCMDSWKEGKLLKRFIEAQGQDFQKFGLNMTFLLLSPLFEFGRQDEDGISLSIVRSCLTGEKSRHFSAADYLTSIKTIERVSKMIFPIFGMVLDHHEDDNVCPMIHAFLVFLHSTSTNLCYQHFHEYVPRAKIVSFFNKLRSRQSEFVTEIGLCQVLPEDEAMADLIFFTSHHRQGAVQGFGSRNHMVNGHALATVYRSRRIMEIGRRLARDKLYLSDNGIEFEIHMPES